MVFQTFDCHGNFRTDRFTISADPVEWITLFRVGLADEIIDPLVIRCQFFEILLFFQIRIPSGVVQRKHLHSHSEGVQIVCTVKPLCIFLRKPDRRKQFYDNHTDQNQSRNDKIHYDRQPESEPRMLIFHRYVINIRLNREDFIHGPCKWNQQQDHRRSEQNVKRKQTGQHHHDDSTDSEQKLTESPDLVSCIIIVKSEKAQKNCKKYKNQSVFLIHF